MIQNQAANKVESPSPSYDQEYNEEEIRHSGTILTKNDVFEGHTARIFSLAVCSLPNGNKISASASHDRTVKIWCVNSNTCLRTIGYPDFVWRVFLVTSLSGKVCIIAFISTENQVYVTDLDTGENLHIVTGRLIYAGVLPLYNFPVIITLVNDEDLAIFDACCGNCVRHIHGGFPRVFRAVVSYDKIDPALIYSTWDSQTRRSSIQAYYLSTLNQPTYDEFAYLENDNSPNESGIIVNNLYQRNTSDDSLLSTNSNQHDPITFPGLKINEKFSPHKSVSMFVGDSRDGITSVSISQSYTTVKPVVCSGHYDHVVRVWDVKTLTLLSVLRGHNDWVISVTLWRGKEPLAVSGSSDGTIKVWDLRTLAGNPIITCTGHTRDVWAVTVTHGSYPYIVSASSDKTVRKWDINQLLLDLRWARRRALCLFLQGSGLLPSAPSLIKPKASAMLNNNKNIQNASSLQNVFQIQYLCREIASFL